MMKNNRYFFILLFLFLLFPINAKDLKDIYQIGSGHIYKMTSEHFPESTVSIYNADVKGSNLWIEFYIESGVGIIQTGLWQQFQFIAKNNSSLKLVKGYIKSSEMKYPEILPHSHLRGNEGLQMSQFLFKEASELKKYLKGVEEVTVPAGTVNCQHYEIKGKEQTINFWIAEDSKPLTMIKLVSTGKLKVHDYKMNLMTLAKNIRPKIVPASAKALSQKMKDTLEKTPLH